MKLLCIVLLLVLIPVAVGCDFLNESAKTTPGSTISTYTTPTSTPAATATSITEPHETIRQPEQSSATITRQYSWRYAGSVWTWTLSIPELYYDYYRQLPRPPTRNYSVYVTHPEDDAYLQTLVDKIKGAARENDFNEWETVNLAVSFVQSLPYTSDSVTTAYDEYPRYPLETLVDGGGDCEDTSILIAAILRQMDHGVVLLSPPDHMAVGVLGGIGVNGAYWEHDGSKYFYLETTGENWEIGEIPSEYENETASIYDIIPVPILTHSWEATTDSRSFVRLIVTVENLGTETAHDAHVFAGFDAGNNNVWNSQQGTSFDLAPNYSVTITINLTIPRNKHTRLVVQMVDDGHAMHTSYSEWFDT